MIETRPNRKELLILVATALLVLLPLIALGSYVVSKHLWAQSRLSELEPRRPAMPCSKKCAAF